MRIGYGRVSTSDQHPELQTDALTAAGCEKLFIDKSTGAKFDRKGLNEALDYVRSGDTLVVWKLDRLGRSLKDLIEIIGGLDKRGVAFVSLTEAMDTSTPGGTLIFHIMGALAEFERAILRERTNAGLAAARARGRTGGRPYVLTKEQAALAQHMFNDVNIPVSTIYRTLGISRATLYTYIDATTRPKGKSKEA